MEESNMKTVAARKHLGNFATVAKKARKHATKDERLELAQHGLKEHLDDIHGAIRTVRVELDAALAAVAMAECVDEGSEDLLQEECAKARRAIAEAIKHAELVPKYLAEARAT
jgi:hypothetical protein